MAIPQPEPRDWIRANAQELVATDREILAVLRGAYKNVNADLQDLVARDSPNLSSGIRRAQLEQTRARLLAQQAKIFDSLGDVVSARRARSAARAQRLSAAADAALLSLVGKGAQAQYLYESALNASQRAIDAALARMRLSAVPLSQRIYRTQIWMDGRLGKLINETLAAGLNAREFAKKARDWFNPNTPGGVRYAAMRLARTEINNAFHAMTADKAARTPWVDTVDWNLSGSHPKRDVCNDRADESSYDSDNVPVRPHPQCMCYITPVSIDEDDFVDNFLKGDYDDFLDDELAKQSAPEELFSRPPSQVAKPKPAPAPAPPPLSFAERLAKAAKDLAALAAPTFGLERRPRPEAFTQEMATAANRYSSTRYEDINNFLRGLPFDKTEERIKLWVKDLDAAFAVSRLSQEVVLYRGLGNVAKMFGDRLNGDLTGMEWEEKAYVSTSALERRTRAFLTTQGPPRMLMRLIVPAGYPAIEISPEGAEAEVLLKRGSKLRIVKDNGIRSDGVRMVDVEVVDG